MTNRFAVPDAKLSRSAIQAIAPLMCEAWNRHDSIAYADLFTVDSDYVAFDGTRLRSRQENEAHHRILFQTVLKGSRLIFEPEIDIVLLRDDVALMHGMGSVLLPWQRRLPAGRLSLQTYVLVAGPEGWRIRAFHNVRFQPRPLPSGAALSLIVTGMKLRTWLAGRTRMPTRVGSEASSGSP